MIRHDGLRRDISRLALQSAAASTAAYLAIAWAGTGEAFLAVISAVLVLQANRDQTIASAWIRIVGALVGTGVGMAALALTAEGTVPLSLAATMLVMGGLAAWKPGWRYGLVAAAALAVGSEATFVETARDRGIAIFVGAAAGIVAGLVVWPESAPARARRQMAQALAICRELLIRTLSSALERNDEDVGELHSRFARALSATRDTAASIKLGGSGRAHLYREAVHRIERLWHALIIIDRVGETRRGDRLPIEPDTARKVDQIRSATCDALACFERFERMPEEDLEALQTACREIWEASEVDPRRDGELDSVALVFGLWEIARNMREIDETICAIAGSR
ncbi:FUSC family protein [Enterovirga sp. GCM10030262]|uniref:FUSC family protein n=1 Tax=Enterovirga sp. GCM10030262 TaxID=3273391 RepID=UPI00361E039A